MSKASPPRTSPTTRRSGRIRNAARTSSRTLTAPAPSALAGRASSRTTCGWASRSSAVSSIVTIRSDGSMAWASAFAHVVLPALVAPATTMFQPARTIVSRNATAAGRPRSRRARPNAPRTGGSSGTGRRARAAAAPRAAASRRPAGRRPSATRDRAGARAARSRAGRCARSRRRRGRTRPARCGRRARRTPGWDR